MATNKTPNLELNQWERTDPVRMEDFNADNAKIDAAVAAAQTAAESAGMNMFNVLTARIAQITKGEAPIATKAEIGQIGTCDLPVFCDCLIFRHSSYPYYGFALRGFSGALTGFGKNGIQLDLSGVRASWNSTSHDNGAVFSFWKGF